MDGEDYNILRDAKIIQAGTKLSQDLGIKKDDYVLVAVFSPSKEITNEPQNNSAMCVYSLTEIEEVFNENIHCKTSVALSTCVQFLQSFPFHFSMFQWKYQGQKLGIHFRNDK